MKDMKKAIPLILLSHALLATCQRPSFAGSRPIGYPEITTTTTEAAIVDKFGEDSTSTTTTQRLPIEAHGDKNLVDRLSKLPIDKQPFWFINWQAYEQHREKPQTFPQRPSQFAEQLPSANTDTKLNIPPETTTEKSKTENPQTGNPKSTTVNANVISSTETAVKDEVQTGNTDNTDNRFGNIDVTPKATSEKPAIDFLNYFIPVKTPNNKLELSKPCLPNTETQTTENSYFKPGNKISQNKNKPINPLFISSSTNKPVVKNTEAKLENENTEFGHKVEADKRKERPTCIFF